MDRKRLLIRGIPLLLVVSLAGCGGEANSGRQDIKEEVAVLQANLPVVHTSNAEQVVQSLGMAPAAESRMEASGSILDNIARVDTLSAFWALLKKSDMVQKLGGTGPYTVFAPGNLALEARYGKKMKDLLKPENKAQLQKLVNTHLIAGKLSVADMENGATIITAGGQQLKVDKKKDQVRINGAYLAAPDAACKNGVVHVVDQVLEPSDEKLHALAE